MSRLKAMGGILIIFIIGVLVGGVGIHCLEKRILTQAFEGSGKLSTFLVNRISRRLDLDSIQKDKLAMIVQNSREKLKIIRVETMPRIQAIFHDAEQEILKLLTLDQQKKFEKLIQKRKTFIDRMMVK
ncbi:MAG: hypothetical protein HYS07_10155 [Chlamydiae bacterium]|nr:hypothetical protein [Chlamydiota bacterium]MBI3277028.1 hypothetical protein [Chlamydiota bacterium]